MRLRAYSDGLYLSHRRRAINFHDDPPFSVDDDGDAGSVDDGYRPTYIDVLVVKAMLGRCGKLPLELVNDIVDHAQYWPHTHAGVACSRSGDIMLPPRHLINTTENMLVCRTPPLGFLRVPIPDVAAADKYTQASLTPRPLPNPDPAHPGHDAACLPSAIQKWLPEQQTKLVEHPCRKIVFTIESHDQGWTENFGDEGTYRGSLSWFDVGLERYGKTAPDADGDAHPGESNGSAYHIPAGVNRYSISPKVVKTSSPAPDGSPYTYEHPWLPDASRLQSNRVAHGRLTRHKIVWSWTDRGKSTPTAQEGAEPEEDCLENIGRGSDTGNGEFVRNLCIGDVVTVWAKIRSPDWVNIIKRVDVDVYWAV